VNDSTTLELLAIARALGCDQVARQVQANAKCEISFDEAWQIASAENPDLFNPRKKTLVGSTSAAKQENDGGYDYQLRVVFRSEKVESGELQMPIVTLAAKPVTIGDRSVPFEYLTASVSLDGKEMTKSGWLKRLHQH
jgi:hypothetical protein